MTDMTYNAAGQRHASSCQRRTILIHAGIGIKAPGCDRPNGATHRHKGARRLRVQRIGLVAAVVVVVITGLRGPRTIPGALVWGVALWGRLLREIG